MLSRGLSKPSGINKKQGFTRLSSRLVGLRGPRRRPEPAQSHPHQLPHDQEAHQRGRSEGGESLCRPLKPRVITAALPRPSITAAVWDTD